MIIILINLQRWIWSGWYWWWWLWLSTKLETLTELNWATCVIHLVNFVVVVALLLLMMIMIVDDNNATAVIVVINNIGNSKKNWRIFISFDFYELSKKLSLFIIIIIHSMSYHVSMYIFEPYNFFVCLWHVPHLSGLSIFFA